MQSLLKTMTGYQSPALGIGRTLADCQSVASLFDNTCDSLSTPVDLDSHAGELMSCTGKMMCPEGSGSETYTDENPCTFTRKLCATCEEDDGEVYIRIQSNQMPNHCF